MTVYEEHFTNVWQVSTPFNQNEDDTLDDSWVYLDEQEVDGYTHGGMISVQQRMALILIFVFVGVILFAALALPRILGNTQLGSESRSNGVANTGFAVPVDGISPLFTPEVQHWTPQIMTWSNQYGLDPNMVATVMQIESCGDPGALSGAGAQGLFQVMPFHFQTGEDAFDPDTNAMRGMSFLSDLMTQFGEPGLAFAGYNGGPGNAVKSWEAWPAEMQRYYRWATGIYEDASADRTQSETLDAWLAAGGAGGCDRAAAKLGLN
ncbi:MAG: lytic transglycosylase domain-containing protein [Chloroflexi bacterium]|nr:lytic transglycosylase domain-containing protein [Chloroflexota bacterium]